MTDSNFTERVIARRLMEQALSNPSGPIMLGSDAALYFAKAVAIPSIEAGARAIARVRGHDPDDLAPLTEMCTGDNEQVPWWKVFEEDAEACLLLSYIERSCSFPSPTSNSPDGIGGK